MTAPKRLSGVLAPVVTPFKRDLSPDRERYVRHCKWLLANGCRGLAVFGTNSEANSLSVDERMVLLETLIQEGVPATALMPGTGCCALRDSVRLTAHATALGCAGVLMLPPFYYKGVSDEGLYRSFTEVIERVGDARLRLYRYHIPPVSQVPITLARIERGRAPEGHHRHAQRHAEISDDGGAESGHRAFRARPGLSDGKASARRAHARAEQGADGGTRSTRLRNAWTRRYQRDGDCLG